MNKVSVTFSTCVLLVLACGTAPPPPAKAPPPPDSSHAIADVDDKCGVLPTCGFQDEDGCPDVVVAFVVGTTALAPAGAKLMDDVARELTAREEISLVEVIGTTAHNEPTDYAKARAATVAAALIKRNVAPTRVRQRGHDKPGNAPGHVYFDVRCGGSGDRD